MKSLKRVRPSDAVNCRPSPSLSSTTVCTETWSTESRYKLSRRRLSRRRPCPRYTTAVRFSRTAIFYIGEVAMHYYGRRTIPGKLLANGFAATMRLLSNYFVVVTDRVSTEGNAIGFVRPSVPPSIFPSICTSSHPFVSTLSFEPTDLDVDFLRVHGP